MEQASASSTCVAISELVSQNLGVCWWNAGPDIADIESREDGLYASAVIICLMW